MPFRSVRTKIMVPFLIWLLVLLVLMAIATVGIFRYQENQRVQALAPVPQVVVQVGFDDYLAQIKQVMGVDVVVFDNADGVIGGTLPDIPSPEIASCVRVADARPEIFARNHPYVSWDARCRDKHYRVVHYPLDRTGRVWTYLLDRTDSIQSQRKLTRWLTGISVMGVLLGALLAHAISRSVTKPVAQLAEATHRVAEGDLEQRSDIKTQDEVGQLAVAFNQMTEQLQASQHALVEAERFSTAGKMSASFAHEIRNPLSSIRMLIQLLGRRIPAESEKYVEAVQQEVERLNVIVDGLLDFARPTAPVFEEVEPSQVVDEVLRIMEANLRHHQIEIHRDYEPTPAIQADTAKLKQVFMNLVLNAMQAMHGGGTLSLRVHAANGNVRIEVADSGVGMTVDQQARLFEPFFTTKERGTGLGLTNVQRLVEEHSGGIQMQSEVDVGTVVTIEIPLKQESGSV